MGVTIHFEGSLPDEGSFTTVLSIARNHAKRYGWKVETIDAPDVLLQRVRGEHDWDYRGPVRGIALYPHEDCDPVRLEFDKDLFVQEFTKTQFAGIDVHRQINELLRALAPHFRDLRIEDEGELWDTGDVELLQTHFSNCERVLQEHLRENPSARAKIKLPDGRILDFVE